MVPCRTGFSPPSRTLPVHARKVGVPYGTHASRFDDVGVPSVVFGPGSITKAHTVDEWLPIDELHMATDVLYRLGATSGEWLGKS